MTTQTETFETATAVSEREPGTYSWVVPPGWAVGRGAWGGIVIGSLINAICAAERDAARVVRSVSAEIAAPATVGEHEVVVTSLRRGSGLSTWGATTVNAEGELIARLTAVLAEDRKSSVDLDYTTWDLPGPPSAPASRDIAGIDMAGLAPEFVQHLDIRPVSGIAYSGRGTQTLGYVRLAAPVAHTAASLIGLVDGWWAAAIVALDRFRPIATINFSANILVDPASIAPDELLLHHGFATGSHAGFTSEQRRLWSTDGRLVVDNLQSTVLIK